MKRIFKWALALAATGIVLAVVAVIVLLMSYNSIVSHEIERSIQAQTGMKAEIGTLRIAIGAPTVDMRNFQLYNPHEFGNNTPFISIPELHMEYDRTALKRHELHIKLLRVNLAEVDIVKDQAGQTNIFIPGISPAKTGNRNGGVNSTNGLARASDEALANFKKQTGFDFTGIDLLDVSIGKVKYIDQGDAANDREQMIGIENCLMTNVKTPADLAGLAADIALHSDGFFDSFLGTNRSGTGILKQLGF